MAQDDGPRNDQGCHMRGFAAAVLCLALSGCDGGGLGIFGGADDNSGPPASGKSSSNMVCCTTSDLNVCAPGSTQWMTQDQCKKFGSDSTCDAAVCGH